MLASWRLMSVGNGFEGVRMEGLRGLGARRGKPLEARIAGLSIIVCPPRSLGNPLDRGMYKRVFWAIELSKSFDSRGISAAPARSYWSMATIQVQGEIVLVYPADAVTTAGDA